MRYIIAIDGYDKTGKTTIAQALNEQLNNNKEGSSIWTHEPFYRPIMDYENVPILLDDDIPEFKRIENIVYYIRDRAIHIKEVILPALENNKIVICDRFYLSTFIYQNALIKPFIEDCGIIQYITWCDKELIEKRHKQAREPFNEDEYNLCEQNIRLLRENTYQDTYVSILDTQSLKVRDCVEKIINDLSMVEGINLS